MAAGGNSRAVLAVRARIPHARHLYIEPDLLRPVGSEPAVPAD